MPQIMSETEKFNTQHREIRNKRENDINSGRKTKYALVGCLNSFSLMSPKFRLTNFKFILFYLHGRRNILTKLPSLTDKTNKNENASTDERTF